MDVNNFQELYKAELQEAYSIETQLVQALPKMSETANNAKLQEAIRLHLEETREHQHQVEQLLRRHAAEPREHTDQSMQAMIAEADKWAGKVREPELRDAGLIASAQRVEHYEMTVYGTLACWAKQLKLDEDLKVLHAILQQEKQADQKLSELAKSTVNPQASAMAA